MPSRRTDWTLRPMRDVEAPAVAQLIQRVMAHSYSPHYPPRAIAFFERRHAPDALAARAREGCVLVVERADDAALLATGAVMDSEIFGVFVDPAAQGLGIGRALMSALEAEGAAAGVRCSQLKVSLPARGFYERLGYQIGAFIQEPLEEEGGETLDFWLGEKTLSL